jgi:hypothetical protein
MASALLEIWLYATVVLAALLVVVIAVQNAARLLRRGFATSTTPAYAASEPVRDLVRAA